MAGSRTPAKLSGGEGETSSAMVNIAVAGGGAATLLLVGQQTPASQDGHGARARNVAIISDGNARWARAHGLSVAEGHEAAADTVIARSLDALTLGVEQLTIYSFSTENWARPEQEVADLIGLLAQRVRRDTPRLHEHGIQIRFIGRAQQVEPELQDAVAWAQQLTRQNRQMTLYVAFNYGGRAEIIDAARRYSGGGEQQFHSLLYAPEMNDPDIVIRTGGEQRLSNYLLWQSAYAELVFREELWPDFTRTALEDSLQEFTRRRRRFGGREMTSRADPVL